MNKENRILIADDHPIFRRGLRSVIEMDNNLKVVAEAENGQEALSLIEEHQPDIAVLDIDMPAIDGLTVARKIREKRFNVEPIFLTMHKDEALFNAAIDLDVKGFIVKDSVTNEIVGCIKSVLNGRTYYSPEISGYLLTRRNRAEEFSKRIPTINDLTNSERRILKLIAESKSNKDIAAELFISVRTVEHHRSHICAKLGLNGKHALITFALTHKSQL